MSKKQATMKESPTAKTNREVASYKYLIRKRVGYRKMLWPASKGTYVRSRDGELK